MQRTGRYSVGRILSQGSERSACTLHAPPAPPALADGENAFLMAPVQLHFFEIGQRCLGLPILS